LVKLRLGQVDDRLHRRDDAVPARACKQRGVIAPALVAVAVGQVDDLRTLAAKQRRMGEIVAVGDDLVRRRHLVEVALSAGQDNPGHREARLGVRWFGRWNGLPAAKVALQVAALGGWPSTASNFSIRSAAMPS